MRLLRNGSLSFVTSLILTFIFIQVWGSINPLDCIDYGCGFELLLIAPIVLIITFLFCWKLVPWKPPFVKKLAVLLAVMVFLFIISSVVLLHLAGRIRYDRILVSIFANYPFLFYALPILIICVGGSIAYFFILKGRKR